MKSSPFKDASRAGLYHLPAGRHQEMSSAARQSHLKLLEADLSQDRTAADALARLGQALGFPDWYGANFDALHDCLTDPDWHTGQGLAVLIDGLNPLHNSDPQAFATLIDVLRAAAESRLADGQALWILLTSPARGVAPLPDA